MLARVSESAVLWCRPAGPLTRGRRTDGEAASSSDWDHTYLRWSARPTTCWPRTGAWGHLVRPLGMLESAEPNRRPLRVPLHRDAQTVYPDWTVAADDQVSRLRAASVRWGTMNASPSLLDELPDGAGLRGALVKFATDGKAPWYIRGMGALLLGGALRINYRCSSAKSRRQRAHANWLPADDSTTGRFCSLGDTVAPTALRSFHSLG